MAASPSKLDPQVYIKHGDITGDNQYDGTGIFLQSFNLRELFDPIRY